MKLNKLNKNLSYTSLLLVMYSLFCLLILESSWYKNNWSILDFYDTPFYILAFIHFIIYWKKYTFNAKVYFGSVVFYLLFKILDNFLLFDLNSFLFYNILILVIMPMLIIIDKNLNK